MMVCVVYCVGKWQSRESTGMFGNLVPIYYIMLQFIWNQYRISNTKQPLQESSRSVVRNACENVIKMVLSVYIPMWSLKSWCSLVLKILLFSWMVCYIFKVIWSDVERTSHSRVWCYVCPLLVSWVPMFNWEAGWGCDVMTGLGALRRGWVRVSGLPSTGIRLPGWVGQRSNPVLCWQQLSSGLHNQIAFLGYGQEVT